MKEIVFILSSLNDPHYRKRVEEFIEAGFKVTIYGFKRYEQPLPKMSYTPIVLGEIKERNYSSRLELFRRSIKSIASQCKDKIIFYSSLDVALFGIFYIKAPYIYECCDLTELAIKNRIIRNMLSYANRKIIRKSIKTIITSEGFSEYFGEKLAEKFYLIPNKVSPNIPASIEKDRKLGNIIKIGFVGVIRFETVYHFVKVCAEYGNKIEVHLYGIYSDGDRWAQKTKNILGENIFYHGPFNNPVDLPSIYNQIDMLLCAYTPCLSVQYAEPNKLYESIYFRCPIIVSKNVFLGDKVSRLGVGYVIDSMNENEIEKFLKDLNDRDYQLKVSACKSIPQEECLNVNNSFFDFVKTIK